MVRACPAFEQCDTAGKRTSEAMARRAAQPGIEERPPPELSRATKVYPRGFAHRTPPHALSCAASSRAPFAWLHSLPLARVAGICLPSQVGFMRRLLSQTGIRTSL